MYYSFKQTKYKYFTFYINVPFSLSYVATTGNKKIGPQRNDYAQSIGSTIPCPSRNTQTILIKSIPQRSSFKTKKVSLGELVRWFVLEQQD